MTLPQRNQIGLVQPDDKPGEWWVTVDGKTVIGFSGRRAQARAEQHYRELFRIADSTGRRRPAKDRYAANGSRSGD